MITAVNQRAEDTYILSDTFEEEIFFVKNFSNKKKKTEKFCPIKLSFYKEYESLLICLGNFPIPDIQSEGETENLRRISLGRLYEFIKSQKIRRLKISSTNFDYEDKTSFSFLLNLLLNIKIGKEFEFLVNDEQEILVQPLNALMSAALKNSRKMTKIILNFSYYSFPPEEFTKILGSALKRAQRLQEFELKTLGKTIPFARIFDGLLNYQRAWIKSLQRLVISCQNFDDRAVALKILTSFKNIKHLKFNANQIDIGDDTLVSVVNDPTMVQRLETFDLSLKNPEITDDGISKFLRIGFPNLTDLKLDLGYSRVTEEAFDGVIFRGMRNFEILRSVNFDVQDADIKEKNNNLTNYFAKINLEGPDDDGEASLRVLKNKKKN